MDKIFFYLKKLNHEFGSFTSSLDSTGWVVLAAGAFLVGFLMMRGNPLRAS